MVARIAFRSVFPEKPTTIPSPILLTRFFLFSEKAGSFPDFSSKRDVPAGEKFRGPHPDARDTVRSFEWSDSQSSWWLSKAVKLEEREI